MCAVSLFCRSSLIWIVEMARKKIREYDSKRLLKEHLKRLSGIDLQICSAQVDISPVLSTPSCVWFDLLFLLDHGYYGHLVFYAFIKLKFDYFGLIIGSHLIKFCNSSLILVELKLDFWYALNLQLGFFKAQVWS